MSRLVQHPGRFPMFRPNPNTIYLGDNGHAYCGDHLGMMAKHTGIDLSGQPIMAITPDMLSELGVASVTCEQPRCGRRPLRVHTTA